MTDDTRLPDDRVLPVGSDEFGLKSAGGASYGLTKTLSGLARDVASGQITHETQGNLEMLQRMNPAPDATQSQPAAAAQQVESPSIAPGAEPDFDKLFPEPDFEAMFPKSIEEARDRRAYLEQTTGRPFTSPIHDFLFSNNGPVGTTFERWGKIASAFGHGVGSEYEESLGLSDDTKSAIKKHVNWKDWTESQQRLARAVNNVLIRPAAVDIDALWRAFPAATRGYQEAVTTAGEEAGFPTLAHEAAALPEAFPTFGHELGTPHAMPGPEAAAGRIALEHVAGEPRPPFPPMTGETDLAAARELGVIGKGGAGWKGTAPPTEDGAPTGVASGGAEAPAEGTPLPEITVRGEPETPPLTGAQASTVLLGGEPPARSPGAPIIPTGAQGAIEGASVAPEAGKIEQPGEAAVEPIEPAVATDAPPAAAAPEQPPDTHAVARQIDPDTFKEYDELAGRRDTFRQWIDELRDTRDRDFETSAPHTEDIAKLQARIDDPDTTPRLRKKYQARLAPLVEERDAYLDQARDTADSPDMAAMRRRLQEADYRMRDLAPKVSAAYREANEQMPAATKEAPAATRESLAAMLDAGASPEEIAQHPLVLAAQADNDARPQTRDLPGYGTPEFEASREFNFAGEKVTGYNAAISRLVDKATSYSTNAPVKRGREATLVLGPPASGKSKLSEQLAAERHAAIVDPDDVKFALPEYDGGRGTSATHEESASIAATVQKKLMDDGTDIIIPRVGGSLDSVRGYIDKLSRAGYRVNLVNLTVDPAEAYRRMIRRFLKTGRIIGSDYFSGIGTKPRENYYIAKGEGKLHEAVDIDGNAPPGHPDYHAVIDGSDTELSKAFGKSGGGHRPALAGGAGTVGPGVGGEAKEGARVALPPEETATARTKPGAEFLVYRLGSATGSLAGRNAGNAAGLADHLARISDFEKPSFAGGAGDTISLYGVRANKFGDYEGSVGGRAAQKNEAVGRRAAGDAVAYSFPPEGKGYNGRLITRIPIAEFKKKLAARGYKDADDAGTLATAEVLRELATEHGAGTAAGATPTAPLRTGIAHIDRVLADPDVADAIANAKINDRQDVPYTAGPDNEGTGLNVDKHMPKTLTVDGKTFRPAEPFAVHEFVERHVIKKLIAGGMDQGAAYKIGHWGFAEPAEGAWYRANGIDQKKAEAAEQPYIDKIEHEKLAKGDGDVPKGLFKKPYPHDNVDAAHKESAPVPKPTEAEMARAIAILQKDEPGASPASEATAAPAVSRETGPPFSIAEDRYRQATAAGFPPEVARAFGAKEEAYWKTRAARFNGTKGTAEEWYRREASQIKPGPGVKPWNGPAEPTGATPATAPPRPAPSGTAEPLPPAAVDDIWKTFVANRYARDTKLGVAKGFNDFRTRSGAAPLRTGASQKWEAGNAVDVGFVKDLLITERRPDGSFTLIAEPDKSGISQSYSVMPHGGLVKEGKVDFLDATQDLRADQSAAVAAPPPGTAQPIPSSIANGVEAFAPADLIVDADRFQFKEGGDQFGVTDRLKGVKHWDPIKAGMILVWEDNAGRRFLVDGHQRFGLAKRIAAEDPSQNPRLNGYVLREADGVTDADARAIAAGKNIAEGTGTAVDAAKVLRNRPDLIKSLPPRSELVRQARDLVNLSGDAFRLVVNDIVPPHYAAIVGRLVPDDAKLQHSLLELLAKTDPANAVQAEAIVRQGRQAGMVTEKQTSLFGDEDVAQSLYLDRAKVLDRALKELKSDQRVFATIVREKDTLESAGNVLAGDINERRASHDAQAIQVLQALASRVGPVSDALGAAARKSRTDSIGAAVRDFTGFIRREAESGALARLADGERRSAEHAGAEGEAGDGGAERAGEVDAAGEKISELFQTARGDTQSRPAFVVMQHDRGELKALGIHPDRASAEKHAEDQRYNIEHGDDEDEFPFDAKVSAHDVSLTGAPGRKAHIAASADRDGNVAIHAASTEPGEAATARNAELEQRWPTDGADLDWDHPSTYRIWDDEVRKWNAAHPFKEIGDEYTTGKYPEFDAAREARIAGQKEPYPGQRAANEYFENDGGTHVQMLRANIPPEIFQRGKDLEQRAFHGTNATFEEFGLPGRRERSENAIFFSNNPEESAQFGRHLLTVDLPEKSIRTYRYTDFTDDGDPIYTVDSMRTILDQAQEDGVQIARIEGIRNFKHGPISTTYAALSPKGIRILKSEIAAFEQRGRAVIKGKLRIGPDGRKTMTLNERADASTLIHEPAHEYLENLFQDAADPQAPDGLKADSATALNYMGFADKEAYDRASPKEQVRGHERFAHAFEAWMWEGRAPSNALARVFAQFSQWLRKIYDSIQDISDRYHERFGEKLPALTDEMRAVYARLLDREHEPTVIAPERERPKSFGERHEEAAETATPETAHETAGKIRAERDGVGTANLSKESQDARFAGVDEGDRRNPPGGAEPGGASAGDGNASGAGPGDDQGTDGGEGNAPVGPRGTKAAQDGAGTPTQPRASGPSVTNPTPAGPHQRFDSEKAGNIRLENVPLKDIADPDAVRDVIRQSAARNGNFVPERRGVVTDAQALALAEAGGWDPRFIDRKAIGDAWTKEEIFQLEILLNRTATAVKDAAEKAKTGNAEDALAYETEKARLQMIHDTVQAKASAARAEAGRSLQGYAALAKMSARMAGTDAGKLIQEVTGRTLFQSQREARFAAGLYTPNQVAKLMSDSRRSDFQDKIIFYYVNALISGPVTHLRYTVGNAINAIERPLVEIPIAAAIGRTREMLGIGNPGERVYLGEAGAQLLGLMKGSRDGISAAVRAFETGVSPPLPGERAMHAMELHQPIGGALGAAIGIPGRSVAAIHSFSKAVRYEQNIQGLAYRTAMREGLSDDAKASRIAELTARPTPGMMDAATRDALKELYMRPTEYHGFMGNIVRAVNQNLLAKIMAPFIKIGTEITRNAFVERTPLGLASREVRKNLALRGGDQDELLAGGEGPGAAFDMQAAKITVGTAVIGATALMAAEGMVTGDGPEDPSKRRVWLLGHRPNTMQIGNITIPYRGLGHFGMLIGFSANLYENAQAIDSDKDWEKVALGFFGGVSKSVLDENFMRGIKDALDALYHPDEYGANYVHQFATNLLPYSVGLGQVTREVDPYQREARTIFQAAEAKMPLLSERLMPRRDMFGEPIGTGGVVGSQREAAPTEVERYANDPVVKAMDALHVGVGKLKHDIDNIQLTDQQYDDYARMAGRIAKMRLNAVVRVLQNESVPAAARIELISKTIDKARDEARTAVQMQSIGSGNDIVKKSLDAKRAALRITVHPAPETVH